MIEIIDVRTSPAVIKVLGVGGGGSNAVARMIQAGLNGVEFWVANTDMQALENSGCTNRLQIGRSTTRGLGAGGNPEVGRLSAEEDRDAIAAAISGADMLFITAGMGGGTGTGAAPIVAEIAQQLGILTVAIVTKPFHFEGKKKMTRALAGMELLSDRVDTLIPIPNQKLLNIVAPGTPFSAAMLVADEVLFQATRGISDLITGHGMINLDFADVKSVMASRGNAILGCGVGTGPNRAIEAAQNAVSSPLLEEVSILGAEALLINVQGGPDMGLHEAAEATQFIADRVGDDADVFWGAVLDPTLVEEMRVTIIATGFSKQSALLEAATVGEAAREPIPQMIPQAVREPIREPIREPVREPIREPIREPVREAAREPVPQVIPQAVREPMREPIREPVREPVRPAMPERVREMPAEPWREPLRPAASPSLASAPQLPAEPSDALGESEEAPAYGPIASDRWSRSSSLESELFLSDPEPGAVRPRASLDWPTDLREQGDEERLAPAPEPEPARRERWWDLDRLVSSPRRQAEAKLGRSPLDKPTFMRKRMED